MKKAAILFHSKTGTTRKYAEEIGEYLQAQGLDAQVSSIQAYEEEQLNGADFVLLGCWTSGLIFIFQHPEKAWEVFAAQLPGKPDAKLALFTTYKTLTGSMFRNMYKHLMDNFTLPTLQLKSRDGLLSEKNKKVLDSFIS
jgi:flavodoxin